MSEVAARTAIQEVVAQIQEDWTDYELVVELDNRCLVDQATQENPYLMVMIDYLAARQADMADRPLVRATGQIVLAVVAKKGSGALESARLRDFIIPYFELKVLDTVNCHAAERQRSQSSNGWEYSPVLINFWQHSISA